VDELAAVRAAAVLAVRWWVAVVVDHSSRKALGFAVFKKQPTSEQVRAFFGRLIAQVGAAPKYLVTDSGMQFTCAGFRP
jgi:hypothetical protein